MEKYVSSARIVKGLLSVRNRRQWEAMVKSFRDGEYTLTLERAHATRSQQANSYYWGVIIHLISEHTGFTPDEVHEYLKARFIPKKLAVCDANGEVVDEYVLGGTTTTMNKLEFGEYVESIRRWAAESIGVETPIPTIEKSGGPPEWPAGIMSNAS